MTNTNTTNTTNTTTTTIIEFTTPADLLKDLHSAMMEKAREFFGLDSAKVTAAVSAAANDAMTKATNAYNTAVKEAAYEIALASEHPVGYLCKARKHTTMHPRSDKKAGVTTTSRSARFDLFDFIEYAASEKVNKPVAGADMLKEKLAAVAEKLGEYVDASMKKDANPVTKHCAAALEDLCKYIGVPGVHGRAKDVRFLSYAVTKAKELGELSKITADTVAPFIMDMYHVQLLGKEYTFESKSENK